MVVVAMMCLNEEEYIARGISSFIPLVDKLFVVDGGSTDRTIEIIKAVTPPEKLQLYHSPWDFDNISMFQDQRNNILSKIDEYFGGSLPEDLWVLSIDPDEAFSSELFRYFGDMLAYCNEHKIDGVNILIKSYYSYDDHRDMFEKMMVPTWRMVLYHYDGTHRYIGGIHEYVSSPALKWVTMTLFPIIEIKTDKRWKENHLYYSNISIGLGKAEGVIWKEPTYRGLPKNGRF